MNTIPQLDITSYPSQFFWFFLSFCILYFIVSKSIIPKIENVIRKRYIITANSIHCIKEDLNLIQQELNKQLIALNTTKNEAEKIINSALQEVRDTNADLMVALNEEVQKMFCMASEHLHSLKHQAEEELIDITFETALMYYSKMLGTEYTDKDKLRDIATKLYKEKA